MRRVLKAFEDGLVGLVPTKNHMKRFKRSRKNKCEWNILYFKM